MDSNEVIIVSSGQEQTVVDGNINGKTLVFKPGDYGNIILRPTKETISKLYEITLTTEGSVTNESKQEIP